MKNLYLFLIVFCLAASNVCAQDIFLKADNITDGAGPTGTYSNYSVISSRQFGVTAESTWLKGTGASVGKPLFNQIVITKGVDLASNKLLPFIAQGKSIPNMEIVSTVASGGHLQVVNKIELKSVFITKITSSTVEGCTDGCPGIAESYEMVYKAIRITTYSQDRKTEKWTANPTQFAWDVASMDDSF